MIKRHFFLYLKRVALAPFSKTFTWNLKSCRGNHSARDSKNLVTFSNFSYAVFFIVKLFIVVSNSTFTYKKLKIWHDTKHQSKPTRGHKILTEIYLAPIGCFCRFDRLFLCNSTLKQKQNVINWYEKVDDLLKQISLKQEVFRRKSSVLDSLNFLKKIYPLNWKLQFSNSFKIIK